jgi:ankyrin repeat protein
MANYFNYGAFSGIFNACISADFNLFQKYVDSGMSLNIVDFTSKMSLVRASICSKNIDFVKKVIESGADLSFNDLQAVVDDLGVNGFKEIKPYFGNGKLTPYDFNFFLSLGAIRNNYIDLIEYLCSLEERVSDDDLRVLKPYSNAFIAAARFNHIDVCKVLLKFVSERNLNNTLSESFKVAIKNSHKQIVEYLVLEHGFDLKKVGENPKLSDLVNELKVKRGYMELNHLTNNINSNLNRVKI